MRNSKHRISACCVAVVFGLSVATQAAPAEKSDQDKALEALRNAESAPVSADQSAATTTTNAPAETAVPATTATPAAETTPAPVIPAPATDSTAPAPTAATEAPHIEAPAPAITPAPAPVATSPEDQAKALEALRSAEAAPVTSDKTISAAPASPAIVSSSGPMSVKDREAQLAEIQRQRKAAEDKAVADRATLEDAARKQREQDDLRVQQAMEAQRNATEMARVNRLSQDETARKLQEQDQAKIREAMEAERIAAEQLRAARIQEEAVLAAERKRAQEEAARRAEQARREGLRSAADTMPLAPMPVTEREKKLAELLRQYQSDEITPYEYHTRRAKIVGGP